jgi:HEPN domain-containing protein
MRPDTAEWFKKADADFLSMTREMNAGKDFNYDLVCFLAQQSVEKYLKGLLCETSVPFPKIHDLNKLAALLPGHLGYPESFSEPISRLDRYAVDFATPALQPHPSWQRRRSNTPGFFAIGVGKH